MNRFRLFTIIMTTLIAAQGAAAQTWVFSGVVTDDGVFSTVPEGSAWTLTVDVSSLSGPTLQSPNTSVYETGFASVSAGGWSASDLSAKILLSNSTRDSITILLDGEDASLGDLEFTNLPGEFRPVEDVHARIEAPSGVDWFPGYPTPLPTNADITTTYFTTHFVVRVSSSVPPTGDVQTVDLEAPPLLVEDLTGDGVVDGADLAALLAAWGPCPGCPADLTGDGIVDGADLAQLLAAWSA